MQKHADIILSSATGLPVASATVTVSTLGGTLATIYSDDGLTTHGNPIVTDASGEYSFYAANGRYSLAITASGFTSEARTDILLYDPDDAGGGGAVDSVNGHTGVVVLTASDVGALTQTQGDARYALAGSGVSDGDKGDITVSGSGAAWAVDANVVTYAKLQDVSATSRVLGRKTAGSGDPEEVTLTELLDFIGSAAQGDILYRGASSWARLAAGTSGQFLKTLGAGANPAWAAAASGSTAGKHAIFIAAGSMLPSVTGGCASLAGVASAANQPDIRTLDFDTTTEEYAQFGIVMPKSWNEGTLTFRAHWSHAATTTNFGVAWKLQAVAVSDDDTIAASYGTAVAVTDTGGTTNDLYTTSESSAITVAGSPAAEDMVFFRAYREPSNGSDTMAIDARLHGITLYITTDAETDA